MSWKTEWLPQPPKNWKDLKPHPLSALVEFGAGIDVQRLSAHMRQNGYDPDEAIVLHGGMILDGRHKHIAAQDAEVTPSFRRFLGTDEDALSYVAKKIFRQHLNESQRAQFAAKLVKLSTSSDPKERAAAQSANLHQESQGVSQISQQAAADLLNVSKRSVADAAKVEEHGTPALNGAVKDGTLSVSDAAKVASEPAKVQNQAVADVKNGKARTASAAAANGKPAQRPKVGAVLFDMNRFDGEWGQVLRQIDKLGNAYGAKDSAEADELRRLQGDFRTKFKAWHKELVEKAK